MLLVQLAWLSEAWAGGPDLPQQTIVNLPPSDGGVNIFVAVIGFMGVILSAVIPIWLKRRNK